MWLWVWLQTADSVSFETNCKLLTGPKFLKRMWPGFLSNGKNRASYQATGNWPDFKDIVINLVRTGSRTSHRLTKVEGIGSRGQDFRDERCIRELTYSGNGQKKNKPNKTSFKYAKELFEQLNNSSLIFILQRSRQGMNFKETLWRRKQPKSLMQLRCKKVCTNIYI